MMSDKPYTFDILLDEGTLSNYDNHVVRKLSDLKGYFNDREAYHSMLGVEDAVLYEVYELHRPELAGEMLHGLSIVHPGKVGSEYFMTKGHFHTVIETSEVYHCLKGEGVMIMETPEGEWAVEPLRPRKVLYVPPRWAHRSVNTGTDEDLVMFFVYPGNAGHDYGSIERQGFRQLVTEVDGKLELVENPRWLPPGKRFRFDP